MEKYKSTEKSQKPAKSPSTEESQQPGESLSTEESQQPGESQKTKITHKWRDVTFKKVLTSCPKDFLELFMPKLYKDYDEKDNIIVVTGSEQYEFGIYSDKGMRISDVLFIVPLKSGINEKVGCFIEIQHLKDNNFSKRIHDICFRESNKNQFNYITACAIYTGNSNNVNYHATNKYGFKTRIEFSSFHVKDFNVNKLSRNNNPFAIVMYAALLSLKSGNNPLLREKYAEELLDMVDKKQYNNSQKKVILDFVQNIFLLSKSDISNNLRSKFDMILLPLTDKTN
jgi:hypothetical protein